MWEKEAHVGWNTVEVRRNDVPAQNAWIAVPWRALAIVWEVSVNERRGFGNRRAYR